MDARIIGGKIAQARKATGLSQARLAQQLFISPQAVGKWERGESMPDITTFNRLAEILGVDLNYFSAEITPAAMPEAKPVIAEPRSELRQVQIDLTAADMQNCDFAGVVLHKGKFKVTSLHGANFAGADLSGSSFETLDAREANFDGANLTDCKFSVTDLRDSSFRQSILVRTTLDMSGQGAKFINVNLTDVQLIRADLRTTLFEHCNFTNVDFRNCDLRGYRFDGQTFAGVQFNKSALKEASFRSATLRNVSFKLPFSLTNKSYLDFKTVCFDGATMDKLTYAALKGLYITDLSKVTVI